MKTLRVPLALLLLTGSFALAQAPVPEAGAAVEAVPAPLRRTPQELEQLLAPIALYPDALIAIILPASTAPADIVLAARTLRDNPDDRSQIEHRAWDESVKSLTNYPDVLKWMDDNLQWTKQVGEAFAVQSADVMQAVQRLRAQARANGTLVDTPQQQVIAEPEAIRIVPAQPDTIYVPYYQPEVVFVDRPVYYSYPLLTFGAGVRVGSWLAYDCDWRRHTIWVGNRHRHWTAPDWRRPVVPLGPTYAGPHFTRGAEVRQWRPPVVTSRTVVTVTRNTPPPPIVRPNPLPRANMGVASRGARPADVHPGPVVQTQTSPAPADSSTQRRYVPGAGRGTRTAPTQNAPVVAATPPAVAAPAATPAATFAPPVASVTPPPAQTSTPPAQRRSGGDWRDRSDNRSHPYSRGGNNSPALVTGPTQPSAPAQVLPPANMPQPTQTFSRTHRAPPPPASNVATAAPVTRHTAPVVTAPVQSAPAPAPAPQAAPAPAQPAPSNNAAPGPRGARRHTEN